MRTYHLALSLEALWPKLAPGGVFIVEDLTVGAAGLALTLTLALALTLALILTLALALTLTLAQPHP